MQAVTGYLTDGLVSVTVQGGMEEQLAASLRKTVDAILSEHHATASVEVSVVSPEVKAEAHNHHISPARYLAIQALQEADPAVTFENCAGHSLSELREQTGSGAGHHGQGDEDDGTGIPPPQGANEHEDNGQHHGREH